MKLGCFSTLLALALSVPLVTSGQKLTVTAVSHSVSERDYTITTPETTNTNCNTYPNSVNCQSTTYGGNTQNKAVYRFTQVVTTNDGGKLVQYTLSRTARWVWSQMDYLSDGDSYPAEIKGKHMVITGRKGGNQGKPEKIKYDILDIRPAP